MLLTLAAGFVIPVENGGFVADKGHAFVLLRLDDGGVVYVDQVGPRRITRSQFDGLFQSRSSVEGRAHGEMIVGVRKDLCMFDLNFVVDSIMKVSDEQFFDANSGELVTFMFVSDVEHVDFGEDVQCFNLRSTNCRRDLQHFLRDTLEEIEDKKDVYIHSYSLGDPKKRYVDIVRSKEQREEEETYGNSIRGLSIDEYFARLDAAVGNIAHGSDNSVDNDFEL